MFAPSPALAIPGKGSLLRVPTGDGLFQPVDHLLRVLGTLPATARGIMMRCTNSAIFSHEQPTGMESSITP